MSVYRSIAKVASKTPALFEYKHYAPPDKFGYQGAKPQPSFLWRYCLRFVFPTYFKFIRGPFDRWYHAALTRHLRNYGLLFDDVCSDRLPIYERACSLLPRDLMMGRLRRHMRAAHMNMLKSHLPLSEQNYDPYVPYLAPYVEEAKFQMQEEDQLMAYHSWDRPLFNGSMGGMGRLNKHPLAIE